MKRLTFALLFTVIISTAFAQGTTTQPRQQASQHTPKTLEERAQDITTGMAKNLRLTPAQVKKVQAINLLSIQRAEEARTRYKEDPRQFAQQMDMISQTRLSQIKDVLTPQQFMQYQDRREEKMGVPKEVKSNPANRKEDSGQDQY